MEVTSYLSLEKYEYQIAVDIVKFISLGIDYLPNEHNNNRNFIRTTKVERRILDGNKCTRN